MPTPAVVITTTTSDTYHSHEDCKIFQAARGAAHTNDESTPSVIRISLGQALAHLHPCPGCLR